MNDHYIFVNKQSLIGSVIRYKLSFPKPDELEMDYRSRVPLPSRLI